MLNLKIVVIYLMMSLDIIRELAELGADLPLSVVIKEEDKYYEVDYITYDYVINEFVLVVKDGTGSKYSTRGDICVTEG